MDDTTEIAISFLTHNSDDAAAPLFYWWLAMTDEMGRRYARWKWDANYWSEEDVRSEIERAQKVDPELARIPISAQAAHHVLD